MKIHNEQMKVEGQNFQILEFEEVVSTNLEAKRLVRSGCTRQTAVWAHTQTSGRGRMDRKWASAQGGVYATFILRPVDLSHSFCLGLAVRDELEDNGIRALLKWPNDVLAGNAKIAGILGEVEKDALCLGLGLNVNLGLDSIKTAGLEQIATSMVLEKKTGPDAYEIRALVESIAGRFSSQMKRPKDELIKTWKQNSATIGSYVRIETNEGFIEGKAVDLGPDFELVVHTGLGRRNILAGDCIHLRSPQGVV